MRIFIFQKNGSRNKEQKKALETQNCSKKFREHHDLLLKNIRNSIVEQKKKEYLEIKQQRELNQKIITENEKKIIEDNKKQYSIVKSQSELGKAKINEFKENRKKNIDNDKINLLLEDELIKKQKELEIKKYELEEMELIKKLQTTKEIHKNLSTEYDTLLNNSVDIFEKKFKNQNKNHEKGKTNITENNAEIEEINKSQEKNTDDILENISDGSPLKNKE